MEPFHEIVGEEFKTRPEETLEGFYGLCDFLQATATNDEKSMAALAILETLDGKIHETAIRIIANGKTT